MKIISIFITVLFIVSLLSPAALAQTPAPTDAEKNEKLNERINDLKEKIASRVSELNLVEKRGIIGTISETSTTSITLTDVNGQTRLVDVDEITKFSTTPARAGFGLSDLSKGMKIRVLGLYNKQSKRILARFVNTTIDPTAQTGAATDINGTDLTMTLLAKDNKKFQIDADRSTDVFSYDKESGLADATFAAVEAGNRVYVVGFSDKDNASLLIPSRVIVFKNLPINPKINISAPPAAQSPAPVAN